MQPIRPYAPDTDAPELKRIWQECGWFIEGDDQDRQDFLGDDPTFVIEHDGRVQGLAAGRWGHQRHGDGDLRVGLVASVNTGIAARRQGLAGRVTARLISELAAQGAEAVLLGIFDDGYYDRLGFGAGPPDRMWTFDPAKLRTKTHRQPVQLGADDWEEIHEARCRRWRAHGSLVFDDARGTRRETRKGYGLGLRDADGTLGGHVWLRALAERRHRVDWLAFRDRTELHDLLGILRTLSDQVEHLWMLEPAGIALQPLLHTPMRSIRTTADAPHRLECKALSWWQERICDLPAALRRLDPLPAFQLQLHDPIGTFLGDDAPWQGLDGDWVVADGDAVRGSDPSLPTLRASVAALSRLWLGAETPEVLALTEELHGPPELLRALGRAAPGRAPALDWDV